MLRGFVLCCLVAPVGADTVFLRNGTGIDGIIKARHANTLELQIGTMGRIFVPLDQIESIEKNDRDGSAAGPSAMVAGSRAGVETVGESRREETGQLDIAPKKAPEAVARKRPVRFVTKFDVDPELRKEIERQMYDFTRERSRFRIRAQQRLLAMGEPTVPFLLEVVDHKNPQVRMAALEIFRKVGNDTVIPAALERLDDENEFVRAAADDVLRELTGERFGFHPSARRESRAKAVAKWRAWHEESTRAAEEATRDAPSGAAPSAPSGAATAAEPSAGDATAAAQAPKR